MQSPVSPAVMGSPVSGTAVERARGLLKKVVRRLLGRAAAPEVIRTHPFDALHGVETSGLLEAKLLRTGHASDAFSTAYFGVPPSRFTGAVERWRQTPGAPAIERCRLIDIGCGKGRALLLASAMPFRDVVGVELHEGLAATARDNLKHWREQKGAPASEVSVVSGDGATVLPGLLEGGPALVYLYNPFRAPALRDLLAGVLAHRQGLSAPVDVLYLFPEHEDVFAEFPAFDRLWREDIAIAPEDASDGLSAPTDPCSLYRLQPA